jgi:hypothetical protein
MLSPQLSTTNRPVALVTGASSGIGRDLAIVLAEHGYDVVLVARRLGELERLAAELHRAHGVVAIPIAEDLRDPTVPQRLFESLTARGLVIDILVNNAGFGLSGSFAETDLGTELDMIQVNIAALTALTKWFLHGMIERGHGRILNLSSTAAFQPGPLIAVYYASKAYVLSFSQAVAEDVRNTGVTVTALCPGPTESHFAAVAGMRNSNLFRYGLVMSSRDVAEFGYRAMMRGTRVAIPGLVNRVVAFASRFAPYRLATLLSRKTQERR